MKKRIIFIVNDIDYFISHRISLAKKLNIKYEVILVCPAIEKNAIEIIERNKIKFENIFLKKNSLFFLNELITFFHLILLFLKYKKSIFHLITIKPVFYGSIIAWILGINKVVYSFSGLGYYLHRDTIIKKIFFKILRLTVQKNQKFIFHNKKDFNFLKKENVIKENETFVTIGSGVDLKKFFPLKKTKYKFRVGFLSRIIVDKGIYEYLDALSIVKKNFDIDAIVAGKLDYDNPSSVSKEIFYQKMKNCDITYLGHKNNVNKVINECDVIILPSYHEGTPKILLEAAACGKSIICTNIPGCKTVVKDNYNGLLIPVKNHLKLSKAIIKIFKNKKLRQKFEKNNFKLAKEQFSIQKVIKIHFKVYEKFK